MTAVPQVTWISYADSGRYEQPDGLAESDRQAHRLAIMTSIRERRVWVSGRKHQSSDGAYVPLVDDRWAYTWTLRAWSHLMACVWSVETGSEFDHEDFYTSAPVNPWGGPADGVTSSITFEGNLQRLREKMKRAREARITRARSKLLHGGISDFPTLRNARSSLSVRERTQALRLATSPLRHVPAVSEVEDERATHQVRARDCNIAAAALASYLAHEVAKLGDDEGPASAQHGEELFSVLLVQRQLEQERPSGLAPLETHAPMADTEGETVERPVLLSDFYIGLEFVMSNARWRCTDVGSRVVVAIKLEHPDDPTWYNGPPYAVAESVLDEYDIQGCEIPRSPTE